MVTELQNPPYILPYLTDFTKPFSTADNSLSQQCQNVRQDDWWNSRQSQKTGEYELGAVKRLDKRQHSLLLIVISLQLAPSGPHSLTLSGLRAA